jgi:hypothetical protein
MTAELITTTEATDLAALAEQINVLHKSVGVMMRKSLTAARKCGELLIQAKSQVPHGQWLPWLESNFSATRKIAAAYMRIADRWDEIEGDVTEGYICGTTEAISLLTSPRQSDDVRASDEPHNGDDHDAIIDVEGAATVTNIAAEDHESDATVAVEEHESGAADDDDVTNSSSSDGRRTALVRPSPGQRPSTRNDCARRNPTKSRPVPRTATPALSISISFRTHGTPTSCRGWSMPPRRCANSSSPGSRNNSSEPYPAATPGPARRRITTHGTKRRPIK